MDLFSLATPTSIRVLAEDSSSRIESFRHASIDVVRKTYRPPARSRWRTWLRRSRAQREFENLRLLEVAGVPCVRGIDWSEQRRRGWVDSCTLTTVLVPDARDLRQELRSNPPVARRRELAVAFGGLLRRLHAAGLCSTTASPRNVLVQEHGTSPPSLLFCDQPFAVRVGTGALGRRLQERDLFDAFFSASRRRDWSAAERCRATRAYAGGDPVAARRLWRRLSRRQRWLLLFERSCTRALSQFARP